MSEQDLIDRLEDYKKRFSEVEVEYQKLRSKRYYLKRAVDSTEQRLCDLRQGQFEMPCEGQQEVMTI